MLKGRLGLETTRVPHADRHGLLWLERGKLTVEFGCLLFTTAGTEFLDAGAYEIPFQQVSSILLGPGTLISHDALRLLARQQTGLVAVGSGGTRIYAVSMPFGPDRAEIARKQVQLWADPELKIQVVRAMYERRFGAALPHYAKDLNSLRGIEGRRMKEVYKLLAEKYGVPWEGRQFDRNNPDNDTTLNQAINHAATAAYASAQIAVAVTGAIPQLGFIHESSGRSFALDIADLYRASVILPIAFEAAKKASLQQNYDIERETRKLAGAVFRQEKLIPKMIDSIKELTDINDHRNHA